MLISPKGDELILCDVLYTPGFSYSILSLGQLMMIGNTILFNDSHCIIEINTEFHIKSKFASFFNATSFLFLFRFHVDFPVTEFNLAINENQIVQRHSHIDYIIIFSLSHIAKVTIA